jgi:hypothetical protein
LRILRQSRFCRPPDHATVADMTNKKQPPKAIFVRLPVDEYEKIKKIAAYEHRGMGPQVAHMISRQLAEIEVAA